MFVSSNLGNLSHAEVCKFEKDVNTDLNASKTFVNNQENDRKLTLNASESTFVVPKTETNPYTFALLFIFL